MALTVEVVTPEREVTVCDDATFVLAHGIEGDVGILPGMAPMLIALGVGPMKIEEGEDIQFVVLGDGDCLPEIRAMSQRLGLDSVVEFTGWVKDDRVIVLAEYAILPEEANAQQVSDRIEELKRRVTAEAEDEHAKRELARQEALHRMLRM